MEFFYDILDEDRRGMLPLFDGLRGDFYLAGGTGLALQIGHRDSVDFDFFTKHPIDTESLWHRLQGIFAGHRLTIVQEERNTLGVVVDDRVKMSFMTYPYESVDAFVLGEHFLIASIRDIGCMKCAAITHRATTKDYIDLYFILNHIPLRRLLEDARQKFPALDTNVILKSLVYFDDITDEPILFRRRHDVAFETVKISLREAVRQLVL